MKLFSSKILLSRSILPLRVVLYRLLGFLDRVRGKSAPAAFVLCYHSAGNTGNRFSMDTDAILQQINYVKNAYTPISLADMVEFLAGRKTYATPVFAITFDDGYASLLGLKNLPSLLGAAPTLFALSDPTMVSRAELASEEELLTSQQLLELRNTGWDIGCHSATHPDFYSLSSDEMANEIIDAKKTLEDVLGAPVSFFAYPKGAYTPEAAAIVQKAGFIAGFTMDDDVLRKDSNIYILPRIGIDNTHRMREFKVLWSPLNIWLRKRIKYLFSL